MKILYLTPQLPYPEDSGGKIKTLSTIKSLLALGHEITLFTFIEDESEKKYLRSLKNIGIKQIYIFLNTHIRESNKLNILMLIFKSFFTGKPYTLLKYYNSELSVCINQYLSNNKIDVIWINFFKMSQYLPNEYSGIRIIESHDIDSIFFKFIFLKSNFLHLRLLGLYEWIKYSIYEKIMYQKFTHIFCISEEDKKILKKIIDNIDITVLQLKLIIRHYKHSHFKKNIMLYIGNLFWYPNRDGIRWFIKNIYPFLREQIPTLQLWIIGKTPKYIKYLHHDGIKYLGYINDISKYIKNSKLFIVPILYGTGIRIKILEAFSWGLPVISTPEGIIGLNLHHRKELLIAKDKIEFFRYVKLLLLSNNEHLHIIKNSKKYLKSKFNEKKIRSIINKVLNDSINRV